MDNNGSSNAMCAVLETEVAALPFRTTCCLRIFGWSHKITHEVHEAAAPRCAPAPHPCRPPLAAKQIWRLHCTWCPRPDVTTVHAGAGSPAAAFCRPGCPATMTQECGAAPPQGQWVSWQRRTEWGQRRTEWGQRHTEWGQRHTEWGQRRTE
eukprot:1159996-Pelagomonas_calceolata.AAC.6